MAATPRCTRHRQGLLRQQPSSGLVLRLGGRQRRREAGGGGGTACHGRVPRSVVDLFADRSRRLPCSLSVPTGCGGQRQSLTRARKEPSGAQQHVKWSIGRIDSCHSLEQGLDLAPNIASE